LPGTIIAMASVFSQMRPIGVPLGMADPIHPNISATLWRTITDHDARRFYYETTLRPSVFWVDMDKVDPKPVAGVKKLEPLGPRLSPARSLPSLKLQSRSSGYEPELVFRGFNVLLAPSPYN
jgi:penicillin V acylase-like amidase (Ntn superfamily)